MERIFFFGLLRCRLLLLREELRGAAVALVVGAVQFRFKRSSNHSMVVRFVFCCIANGTFLCTVKC